MPKRSRWPRRSDRCSWDDLNFEREFAFIPRDVYSDRFRSATSFETMPFDRWRELNADGVIIGTVQKAVRRSKAQLRLYNVRTRQMCRDSREYTSSNAGSSPTPRPTSFTSRSAP